MLASLFRTANFQVIYLTAVGTCRVVYKDVAICYDPTVTGDHTCQVAARRCAAGPYNMSTYRRHFSRAAGSLRATAVAYTALIKDTCDGRSHTHVKASACGTFKKDLGTKWYTCTVYMPMPSNDH